MAGRYTPRDQDERPPYRYVSLEGPSEIGKTLPEVLVCVRWERWSTVDFWKEDGTTDPDPLDRKLNCKGSGHDIADLPLIVFPSNDVDRVTVS